jgi:hypothetical protein
MAQIPLSSIIGSQMPALTIKGNDTGSTAVTADLTVAQVNAILPVFTSGLNGVTPASGGGTTNFLRADGTWAAPAGGDGTVTSVSVTPANGVSGSVATATTTPAITITLGAITPSSVASTGAVTGTNLSGTNTGDQTITLTGDVTGTGTGSFAATIGANRVTLPMMATMATASFLGRNTGGTGNVEVLAMATARTMLSINNVENTALSTWAGSTAITTLGTIGTGTWNATTIAVNRGGTGLTSYTTNNLLYATGATTLAGLTTANNGVLVTNGSGVPSIASTLPSGLSIPGMLTSVAATVSAAGTTQGGATAISTDVVVTTTVAVNSGVVLPTAVTGKTTIVVNKGANALKVYPAVGGAIDALGTNVAITVPVDGWLEFNATSATQWYSSANDVVSASAITGTLTNSQLANSAVTVGSTSISLGATATTIAGLTSVTSTTFVGALTGNASTSTTSTHVAGGAAGQVHYQSGAGATAFLAAGTTSQVLIGGASAPAWSNTPTLTGTNFTGIPNGALTNSAVTIGNTSVSLGATVTTFTGLTSVTSTTFVGALTGNASTVTTNANLTGPITSSGNATSVTANAITNAMLAQMPTLTIKGNNTGGTANAGDLTVAQVNAILPVFTSGLNGLTPASGGGTTNFLRADGTWAAPAGGGGGTVTSVSVTTANGVSGSVATATTTPAITITLGAITPSSVASTGAVTGTNLSGTNTGDQTITLTGDVTGSGTGSFAATIAAGSVTLAKMANLAANSFIGNNTGSAATPIALTVAQAKTLLALAKADVGLSLVENTALSTWTGAATITTVGTIATGTWNATAIGATVGGTGQTVYAVGDIIQANTTTTLQRLPAVATGNVLISGGVGTVSSWGKVALATHVSGTLPVANGGTGVTTSTGTGNVVLSASPTFTGTLSAATITASGNVTGLNLSGTNTGDQTITLTGDVTGSGTGSFATTIGTNKVTLPMMATMATASFLGRITAATGNVEVLSVTNVRNMLSINNVENTALSTWAGSANITTVGTISSTGATFTGKLNTVASGTGAAGLNIPHGAAPTTPTNGDVWTTTTDVLVRLNGTTKTLARTDSNITGSAASLTTGRTISTTGDVTYTSTSFDGTGNVTGTATIANGVVTLAKMANMATNSLIGRSTGGSGVPEIISVGSGLLLSGGVLTATGGAGGGVTWTTITNSNVSPAVTNTGYIMETGGVQRTVTLPASAVAGFNITVNANAGTVKIISNGNVIDGVGAGNDLILDNGDTATIVGKATGQLELIYGGVYKGSAPAGGTTGQVLAKNSGTDFDYSWATPSGGGGSPGGSTTQIQYNNAGAFAGSADFTWDDTTKALTIGGTDPEILMNAVTNEPGATPAGMLAYYTKSIAGRMVPKVKGPSGLDYPLQASLWQNNTTMWTPTTATAGFWQGTAGAGAGTFSTALPTATTVYTSMKRARWANVVTTANQVLGQRNTEAMYMRGSVAGQGGFFFYARCGMDVWTNGGRFFAGMHTATTVVSADPSALNNTVGFCVDAADNGAISFLTRGTAATKASTGMTFTSNTGFDVYIFCSPNSSTIGWRIVNINTGAEASGVADTNLPANTTMLTAGVLASNAAVTPVTSIQLGLNRIYVETDY